MGKEGFEFVTVETVPDDIPVICDGQNRLSERILFGDIDSIIKLIPVIVQKVATDFGIPKDKLTGEYYASVFQYYTTNDPSFGDGANIFILTELSLQQAVNLAQLLMRMEIDIQKYTQNIPTVGGVVKIAVIDQDGFKYVAGNDIVKNSTI